MPSYVDTAWGYGDRLKAATIMYDEMECGKSWEEAWVTAEIAVYRLMGISRKQHYSPQNQKEHGSMKEES